MASSGTNLVNGTLFARGFSAGPALKNPECCELLTALFNKVHFCLGSQYMSICFKIILRVQHDTIVKTDNVAPIYINDSTSSTR